MGRDRPDLRACGLEWDLRKKRPYSGYDQFEFDIPTAHHGDCYDRAVVRVEEMRQSLRIIEQCLNNMPAGSVQVGPSPGHAAAQRAHHARHRDADHPFPERELGAGDAAGRGAGAASRRPKGNNGYYLISDGGTISYRTRIRTPSFAHMQMLPLICRGLMIPDLVAILGSIDFVLADVDR